MTERFGTDVRVPLETTLAGDEPQSAKKQRVEPGVSLNLPPGVVVPTFYEEERDASFISVALQLGADAVRYIQSQSNLKRQEVFDQKETVRIQRTVEQRVRDETLALKQSLRLRKADIAELEGVCRGLHDRLSKDLQYLQKQGDAMRALDEQLQVAHGEKQRSAVDNAQNPLQLDDESQTEDGEDQPELLSLSFERQARTWRAEDMYPGSDISKLLASHSRKADDQPTLKELIRRAFDKLEVSDVLEIFGDRVTARISGLQTRWYLREESNVKQTKAQIINDLKADPTVDVAFLIALKTGFAGRTEQLFNVEMLSPNQTLVYVNKLTASDDPAKVLQTYVHPLLSALRRVKQLYTEVGSDMASRLRLNATRWVETVNKLLIELDTEKAKLQHEISKSQQQFEAREKRIKKQTEALNELLKEMKLNSEMPSALGTHGIVSSANQETVIDISD